MTNKQPQQPQKKRKKRRSKPYQPKHAFTVLDRLGEDVQRKLKEALKRGGKHGE